MIHEVKYLLKSILDRIKNLLGHVEELERRIPTTVLTKDEFEALETVDPNIRYAITENRYVPEGFVDLGLPSGTMWAKCNLGAEEENEYGDYYQWGSTVPDTDRACTWATDPFNNGQSDLDETYFQSHRSEWVDPSGVLKPTYDAAHVLLGNGMHIPTDAQILELAEYTEMEMATIDGTRGWRLTSKAYPSRYIFIPAAGWRANNEFEWRNDQSYTYTRGSQQENPSTKPGECNALGPNKSYGSALISMWRYWAIPIRPVYNSTNS